MPRKARGQFRCEHCSMTFSRSDAGYLHATLHFENAHSGQESKLTAERAIDAFIACYGLRYADDIASQRRRRALEQKRKEAA